MSWLGERMPIEELSTKNEAFFAAMAEERERQIKNWGILQPPDFSYVSILGEEYGEVCKAMNEDSPREAIVELVHVATVAMAFAESLGLLIAVRVGDEA